MNAKDIVTRCPHCGAPLSGLMVYTKRRWHLDGKCLGKEERSKRQKQRKIQPQLPLKGK